MSDPNTIDYSNLNKSLQPKRKMNLITDGTAEALWKVFTSELKTKATKIEKIDALSDQIKEWSENMKVRLILTLNYLSSEWLLKPEAIKSLSATKIREIAWGQNSNNFLKDNDKKIQNIIDYLIDSWRKKGEELTSEQKEKLNQTVIDWLNAHYWNLADKEDMSEQLQARNQELEEELNASEAANEVVEAAVLKRFSRNNMIRVWKSIENINNSNLDPVTKARKVLWQANSFAILGTWKRFDWINKLPKKIDVNKEYREAVDNLKKKMSSAQEAREKVAIRYIMRQINRAYTTYINETNISEEARKQNMRDINMAMSA